MQRISSRTTIFYKRIFPAVWFGFIAVFILIALFARSAKSAPLFPALIIPIFMAAFGYFIMKRMIWDLADEVLDGGDSLVVRNGHEQESIPLSNIINVSYSFAMNPPRVTLTLRTPSRFGNEISFSPPKRFSLVPFSKSPLISDLIQRVDAARRSAG